MSAQEEYVPSNRVWFKALAWVSVIALMLVAFVMAFAGMRNIAPEPMPTPSPIVDVQLSTLEVEE